MKFHRMYALSIRHLYLIKGSFPRILDLIYWPTIQIILWGFISQFFTMHSDYYNNTIGVILKFKLFTAKEFLYCLTKLLTSTTVSLTCLTLSLTYRLLPIQFLC